jgi:hypothetical protein
VLYYFIYYFVGGIENEAIVHISDYDTIFSYEQALVNFTLSKSDRENVAG